MESKQQQIIQYCQQFKITGISKSFDLLKAAGEAKDNRAGRLYNQSVRSRIRSPATKRLEKTSEGCTAPCQQRSQCIRNY